MTEIIRRGRILLILGLVWSIMTPVAKAASAITLIQHTVGYSAAVTDSVSVTIGPAGAGHLLVVGIVNDNHLTVSKVTDDRSNTYVQAANAFSVGNYGHRSDIWYVLSAKPGVTTITAVFNKSSGAFPGTWDKTIFAFEVAGFTTSAKFDVANHTTYASSPGAPFLPNIGVGAPVTTTSDSGFIVGVISTNGLIQETPLAGNEFTSGGDLDSSPQFNASCSLISTSAGVHQPVWMDDYSPGGTVYASSTAAFKN